mmetsp:Transcript_22267/g.26764  ORF Transcript_22267/g.26764 Transcript_22267/m.26764 type:complete len:159 (+) Transcript_22267:80-556(+)|eukprot:CAMPEP_0197854906 /NCGR_PEP_ID=MMETSP1438-20131217/25558_1 /TAXON_ID=1461541 /ORGANISM="Pterosperma sp., Strain CCMP1384" /LENGTH=158 /DNA_ID=CAMNT_0043469817 /DNA_START=80 /DNA_END=556 /DNA_ORIENTATION=-
MSSRTLVFAAAPFAAGAAVYGYDIFQVSQAESSLKSAQTSFQVQNKVVAQAWSKLTVAQDSILSAMQAKETDAAALKAAQQALKTAEKTVAEKESAVAEGAKKLDKLHQEANSLKSAHEKQASKADSLKKGVVSMEQKLDTVKQNRITSRIAAMFGRK